MDLREQKLEKDIKRILVRSGDFRMETFFKECNNLEILNRRFENLVPESTCEDLDCFCT